VDYDDIVDGVIDAGADDDKVVLQDTDAVAIDAATFASMNAEWFVGGSGADEIDASLATAPVTLEGSGGADTLTGGIGDDSLDGGGQSDSIMGGDGDDALLGGDRDDTLEGGAGDDLLEGNADDDMFVMTVGMENDTIVDFKAGGDADQIDVSAFAIPDWATFSGTFFDTGTATEIDMSVFGGNAGDLITIEGVAPAGLAQADFVGVP
jgi:Ca2+-binding RTX toxin-like protein